MLTHGRSGAAPLRPGDGDQADLVAERPVVVAQLPLEVAVDRHQGRRLACAGQQRTGGREVVDHVEIQAQQQVGGGGGVQRLRKRLAEATARRPLEGPQEAPTGATPARADECDLMPTGDEPVHQPGAHRLDATIA
jgi:hypothetical protein